MEIYEFRELPGTVLPSGSFTITDVEDHAVRAITLAASKRATADSLAHPLWAYIATQRGIGISVADLCALAEFDIGDGPMLGSVELEYSSPMKLDEAYAIDGEILDIVRKEGRSGTFDIMTYRERMVAADGTIVASTTNTFILPRRQS